MKYRLDKWPVRWTESWLNCQAEEIVISCRMSSWRMVTSSVPQGSVRVPTLFNISMHYLDDGIKCILIKFIDDTELGRVVDNPDEHAAIQSDQDRLEKWPATNLMKFNKEKSKILLLGRNNPMLGPDQQESSFAVKDLTVQMDNKLTTSQSHMTKSQQHPGLH